MNDISILFELQKRGTNKLRNPVIGHRGAAAYAPENTLASFNKAQRLGCDFIEFDVMLSADGHPFVFHDETLKRTTNGRGDFGKVNKEYIQSLDAGRWFSKQFLAEKIPSFSTALMWLLSTHVKANIEIKPYPGTTEQTTIAVLKELNTFWPENRPLPLVSSFDFDALTLCRSLSPELPLGLLLDKWQEDCLKQARNLDCYSIHLSTRAATPERVRAIKAEGFSVYVYTVNRPSQALKLLKWGVDAVFSDYPDLLGFENAILVP